MQIFEDLANIWSDPTIEPETLNTATQEQLRRLLLFLMSELWLLKLFLLNSWRKKFQGWQRASGSYAGSGYPFAGLPIIP